MITFSELEIKGLEATDSWYRKYAATELYNQDKVLRAFRNHRVNYQDFQLTSGYGMGDTGRDKLERIYAEIFRGEDSLIRQQIVSGTHSITLALFAMLLPNEKMVIYGEPYDTLYKVLGRSKDDAGSLAELGITYKIHPFGEKETLASSIEKDTKVFYIQRSKGYSFRNALTIDEIEELIQIVRSVNPGITVFVDNCYGEFCEEREPLEVGADLIAGSLIKNPGGAIAPSGGYLVGREDLIERASYRLTAPGIGKEVGPSLISNSSLYQGIFNAPHIVAEALKGSVYISAVLEALGYEILPKLDDPRSDIVELICFHDPEPLKSFCRGIQKYSPVDSHVIPEAWDMPGYENQVIMASGGFVEGSSIELSADGPLREPYICYVQGGMSFPYIKLVIDHILKDEWHIS
ncbi:MAG: aminotransferase class I/II-fold pyridoxal phosphate-dependent enzyme [Clostridia bacterium]